MKLDEAIKAAERIAGGDTTNLSVGEVIRTLLAEIHANHTAKVPEPVKEPAFSHAVANAPPPHESHTSTIHKTGKVK